MITNNQNKTEDELLTIENNYWVSMHEALDRLKSNEDFKTVILDGYFKDKAVNGVSLLSTDYTRQNGVRGEILEQLVAISALEDFFGTIDNLGTLLPEDEEEE
jgi:hypothetical protein